MSVVKCFAPVAIALSLVGCGTAPLVGSQVAGRAAPVLQTQLAHRTIMNLSSHEMSREMGKHPGMMRKMRMKKLFERLEAKHPDLKDQLEGVQARLDDLNLEQRRALHGVLWNQIKDQTIAEFHRNLHEMFLNPAKMISFLNKDLDRVEAMSSKELSEVAASLPHMGIGQPASSAERVTPPSVQQPAEAAQPAAVSGQQPAEAAQPATVSGQQPAEAAQPATVSGQQPAEATQPIGTPAIEHK